MMTQNFTFISIFHFATDQEIPLLMRQFCVLQSAMGGDNNRDSFLGTLLKGEGG